MSGKNPKKQKQTKPLYAHDCTKCVYLGVLEHPKQSIPPCDLYVCLALKHRTTVIARYSKEPEDYCSGLRLALVGEIPELVEALRRAVELGILTSTGEVVDDRTADLAGNL